MYNSSDVADKLREVAKLRGVTMKEVLKDAGLGKNMMTMMRDSMPKSDTLAKLADRLDCSVDYLLGRSSHVQTQGTEKPVIGPTQNAAKMLSLFIQLPEEQQNRLIGRAEVLVEQAQREKEGGGEASGSSPAKAV